MASNREKKRGATGAAIPAFHKASAAAAQCHILNVTQNPGGWERVCVLRGDFAIRARRYQRVARTGWACALDTVCPEVALIMLRVKAVRDVARALSLRRGIGALGLRCDGECLSLVEEEGGHGSACLLFWGCRQARSRAARGRHVTCRRDSGTCGCALASRDTPAGASSNRNETHTRPRIKGEVVEYLAHRLVREETERRHARWA